MLGDGFKLYCVAHHRVYEACLRKKEKMTKHKALIVGAGRIGAGYQWDQDLEYTHAGAYRALSDRVELVGFVEIDPVRADDAHRKWGVPVYYGSDVVPPQRPSLVIDMLCDAIGELKPDIVSVCTNPDQDRDKIMKALEDNRHIVKAVWCEKPYVSHSVSMTIPVQVNYQRRGDTIHRTLAKWRGNYKKLAVYGKDDETTRCHFRDLAKWWAVPLDYRPFQGPCAYALDQRFFDNGGVDSGKCFKAMLSNLMDHLDYGDELWSPPYAENQ